LSTFLGEIEAAIQLNNSVRLVGLLRKDANTIDLARLARMRWEEITGASTDTYKELDNNGDDH
jgi:hypothetical protein